MLRTACLFAPQTSPRHTCAPFAVHPQATSSFSHPRLPDDCRCRQRISASQSPIPVSPSLTTGHDHPAGNILQLSCRNHRFPESRPERPVPCTSRSAPIWPFSIGVIQFRRVDTKQPYLGFLDHDRVAINDPRRTSDRYRLGRGLRACLIEGGGRLRRGDHSGPLRNLLLGRWNIATSAAPPPRGLNNPDANRDDHNNDSFQD